MKKSLKGSVVGRLARAGLGLAGAAALGLGVAASAGAAASEPALALLVSAREAANARLWGKVEQIVPALQADLLGSYPEYWLLRPQLQARQGPFPATDVARFLEDHRGTYLEQRVRGEAILAAMRRGEAQWVLRLAEGLEVRNGHTECAILLARQLTGGRVSAAQAQTVFTPGEACWALYDTLYGQQILGQPLIARQMRDAVDVDAKATALRLGAYFLDDAQEKALAAAWDDPMPWLRRLEGQRLDPARLELVVAALARLARKDMLPGHRYFLERWAAKLPTADAAWVQAHFALLAALRQNDVAHAWYRQTEAATISDYSAEWRVRSGLRQPEVDWAWVLRAIELMPDTLRAEPAWRYWRARGLAATGQPRVAQAEFSTLATRFDYYGLLAGEELGISVTVPPSAPAPSEAELGEVRQIPGLQRALALFALDWRSEAVPEWNYALRGMTDRQLLAAAEIAREAGLYDRVVNTSERTREQHDFRQRFIAPFAGQVTAKAREVGVDPAWVYGLIRQESRFVTSARSGVGATGLMQLMPATARWVARRIGMEGFHPSRINDFDVNTTLGTSYLQIVLQDLDGSQLLASAGYNAGPRRPLNWRATYQAPVEGAIFAETIPFTETRDYVQKVLANATVYTALFTGEPQSLKARLGVVAPVQARGTETP
ncbi:MAG: lytic transglycosylase domain-containing protein [Pigmentiphaga sp.]|nr:lytic transglycosylase domain-containing protein [Pigmentiphaga sp.]